MARYDAAERLFRRAIELDPLDAQAHHFLADACIAQSSGQGALVAATGSIAANPAYYPAWQVLQLIRGIQGRPLQSFRIRRGARVIDGADGTPSVSIFEGICGSSSTASAWVVYAMVSAGLVPSDVEATGSTAFAAELRGFRAAFKMVAAGAVGPDASEGLSTLVRLRDLDAAGDLPTALLLLAYDELYREDLEDLKRERPDACAQFLERYDLRPF